MEKKTTKELKVIAKELGVKGWWDLKKADLIKAIEEKQQMTPEEQQAEAEQKALEYKAMAAYDKNWRKYTQTYDPLKFIEEFRAGKIVLEDEEPEVEENLVPMPGADIDPEEGRERGRKQSVEKPETTLTPKRGALIEYNGKAQNICKWGEELGISPNTLYGRIYKMGWTVERAFTTPGKKKK